MSVGVELWLYERPAVPGRLEIGASTDASRAWGSEHGEEVLACARGVFERYRNQPADRAHLRRLARDITDALRRAGHEGVIVWAGKATACPPPEGPALIFEVL